MDYQYDRIYVKDRLNVLSTYSNKPKSLYCNDAKKLLFESGLKIINDFANVNDIKPIVITLKDFKNQNSKGCYWYGKKCIDIDINECSRVNPMYSFPGFTSNATPQGVIAHEYGHYVADVILSKLNHSLDYYRKKINEPCVTSYCPTSDEYFAEQLKVFIINPDLLKTFYPNTYNLLCTVLIPLNRGTYLEVLNEFVDEIPKKIYERIEVLKKKRGIK